MRYVSTFVATLVVVAAAAAHAQEPRSGRLVTAGAFQAQEPPRTGQLISLDLLFADVAGETGEGEITAAKILELEKQGKLQSAAHVKLATVENQESQAQFGENVPVMTGRMFGGGRGGRGGEVPAGAFPGGEAGATYSMQQFGTTVHATTRIDQDGTILIHLQAERSRLIANRPAGEEAGAPSIAATKTGSTNARTTVRVASGKPVIVCGQQTGTGKEAIHSYVVLTASVPEGAKVSLGPDEMIRVFTMSHARAADMVNHVRSVLGAAPIAVAADERTNSLIVSGPESALDVVRALVMRLDEAINPGK